MAFPIESIHRSYNSAQTVMLVRVLVLVLMLVLVLILILYWGIFVVQRFGCWTFDQVVVGSSLGRGVINTPRSTQPPMPSG